MQYSYQDSNNSLIKKMSRLPEPKVKVIGFGNLNSEQTMVTGTQLEISADLDKFDFLLKGTQDYTNSYQLEDSIYANQDQDHEELKRARFLKQNEASFGLAISNVYEFYDADDKGMYFTDKPLQRLSDEIFNLYSFPIKEIGKTKKVKEEANKISQCAEKAHLIEEHKESKNQPGEFRKEVKKKQENFQDMTKNKMEVTKNIPKKSSNIIRRNGKRAKEYCYSSDSDAEFEMEVVILIS